jgi:O-glycosyl hydrolase
MSPFPRIAVVVACLAALPCPAAAQADPPSDPDAINPAQASQRHRVVLHLDRPGQPIDGFGASTAWYADEIAELSPEVANGLLDYLFGDDGLSLDILRVRIAPHPSTGPEASYDWQDERMVRQGQIVAAVQDNYGVRVMAVPWTAPRWMKDNGEHKNGGRLLDEHRATYAAYLAEWVIGMQREFGVTIDILSVQNEPGVKQWESMEWAPESLAAFTRDDLLPELDRRGVDIKLMLNEETGWQPGLMIDRLLADPALAEATDLVAAHAYRRTHGQPTPIDAARRLGKPVWMTEFYLGDYTDKHVADPLHRDLMTGQVMHRFFADAGVNAYLFWWAVSPPDKAVQGLVEVDIANPAESGWTPRRFAAVYGQFSHFVEPGSKHLPVALDPLPAADALGDGLDVTAFALSDSGDAAVVAVNNTDVERHLSFYVEGSDTPLPFGGARITDADRELAEFDTPTLARSGVTVPARSAVTVRVAKRGR